LTAKTNPTSQNQSRSWCFRGCSNTCQRFGDISITGIDASSPSGCFLRDIDCRKTSSTEGRILVMCQLYHSQ
jgi:hypothetical protein